ncbi:hypothetical protein K3728_12670 [Rhodobacteraceae bacterium M385]|nr:hypothetical protein K3728_12670 [Rhodobacteraceae bacterium M385]
MIELCADRTQLGLRQRSLRKCCRLGRATELIFVLATGVTLVLGGTVQAQDAVWIGVSTANFGDASSWDTGVVPSTGDLADFDIPAGNSFPDVDLGGVSVTIGSVEVNAIDVISNGTLQFDNSGAEATLTYSDVQATALASSVTLDTNGADLGILATTDMTFGGAITNSGGGTPHSCCRQQVARKST